MGRMYKPPELMFQLENVDLKNVSNETMFLMREERYRYTAKVSVEEDTGVVRFQLQNDLEEYAEYRLYFSDALSFANGRPFPQPYFLRIRVKNGMLYASTRGSALTDEEFFAPERRLIFTSAISVYFNENQPVLALPRTGGRAPSSPAQRGRAAAYRPQKKKKTGLIAALTSLFLLLGAAVYIALFASVMVLRMVKLVLADKLDASDIAYTYSADYDGPTEDDTISSLVDEAGGSSEGVLRASLLWNYESENLNDYDLICVEPDDTLIYFRSPEDEASGGKLDVDIIKPEEDVPAIENIVWTGDEPLPEGVYAFYVLNYTDRDGVDGFTAELACGGTAYSFSYPDMLEQGEFVKLGECFCDADGNVALLPPEDDSSEP